MARPQAKAGPPSAWLRVIGFFAALTPAPAFAGAWIAPPGGQEISTVTASERDGAPVYEGSAYWEAPLGEKHALVLAPWAERDQENPEIWRAETTLGLKRTILSDEDTVVALQASAVWVTAPPDGCGEGGAEARWLGGRTIGARTFVNLEAATRALEGGCGGERLDLTLGHRPGEHWLGLAQVFLDAPADGRETVQAQVSLVAFGANDRGIQIGLRARLDGEDAEPALVLGFWRRPLS